MVAAVGVRRAAVVLTRQKSALVAAGIIGPQEEVLVMTVTVAGIDAVHAPRPMSP